MQIVNEQLLRQTIITRLINHTTPRSNKFENFKFMNIASNHKITFEAKKMNNNQTALTTSRDTLKLARWCQQQMAFMTCLSCKNADEVNGRNDEVI